MIQFYQFPWSPYCLVTRRILEFGRIPFRSVEVPAQDRSQIWRLTRERYYQVPVIKDGRQVLFETDGDSQVIAKYLDQRFNLGLFPREWEGVQDLLWRHFENDVEGVTFRLNDAHWREFVPAAGRCAYLRHKERKFGRGCLEDWLDQQESLQRQLEVLLLPAEQMLATRAFLLADRPLFVDFCLHGMLSNFLYSGHYELPAAHGRLGDWYARTSRARKPLSAAA